MTTRHSPMRKGMDLEVRDGVGLLFWVLHTVQFEAAVSEFLQPKPRANSDGLQKEEKKEEGKGQTHFVHSQVREFGSSTHSVFG